MSDKNPKTRLKGFVRKFTSLYPLNTPRASILRFLPAVPRDFGPFCGKDGLAFHGYWPADNEVSPSLFWFGDFDPWVNYVIRRLVTPGSVALDVGAYIGDTAFAFSKAVGPHGRVVCFEPLPFNVKHLRANIEGNGLSNVDVVSLALSDCEQVLRMSFVPEHAAMAQICSTVCSSVVYEIQTITLDGWLADKRVPSVSLCKIDVEGHEGQVLAGMHDCFDRKIIQAMLLEHHVGPNVTSDPVFDVLNHAGYQIFRIDKGPMRVRFVELGKPPTGRPTHDFVALLPNRGLEHRLGIPNC